MKRIIQYTLFTFVFSWSMWGLQYLGQEGIFPEWVQLFGMFGMFGPLVALLIMIKLEGLSYKTTFKNFFTKASIWTILFVLISPMILLHWFAKYSSAIFPYFYSTEGRYALLVLALLLDGILMYHLHRRQSIFKNPSESIRTNE